MEQTRGSESGRKSIEEIKDEWLEVIDQLIEKVETVSSHFRYTEEYVFHKSTYWLNRKIKQVDREKYQEQQTLASSVTKGMMLIFDSMFNDGKNTQDILPSYEEALEKVKNIFKRKYRFKI